MVRSSVPGAFILTTFFLWNSSLWQRRSPKRDEARFIGFDRSCYPLPGKMARYSDNDRDSQTSGKRYHDSLRAEDGLRVGQNIKRAALEHNDMFYEIRNRRSDKEGK